jgi:peptidoglycan/LPS O-acetylase OafA/YrhL
MTRATRAGALDPPWLRASSIPSLERRGPVERGHARYHEFDRLRILAVLLLFPFHAARVFNENSDWYVKNVRKSPFLSWVVVDFLDPWHMPLLFVLAGMATWFAFRHRTAGTYARERTRRLLVPLLWGIVVIVPPQPYLAQLSHPGHESSYLGFLNGYFTDVTDLSGYDGGFTPAHMWFVMYLFLFALLTLPVLVAIHRAAMRRDVGRLWMLGVAPVAFLLTEALPSPEGAWSPFTTMVLFVAGFVLASSDRLMSVIRRRWRPVMLAAVGAMTLQYAIWITGADAYWGDGTWQDAVYQLFEGMNTWLWVLGLVGAAGAFLARPPTPLLRYANEAAYPWYVLHQTVIVMLAYVIVRWDAPLASKYVLLLAGSAAITFALYEVTVRRMKATRFLFGLKLKPRAELA